MVELKEIVDDNEELKIASCILKTKMYKGCANKCPKCKRKGNFGSIEKYQTELGNDYLLCGWCGSITEINQKKPIRR